MSKYYKVEDVINKAAEYILIDYPTEEMAREDVELIFIDLSAIDIVCCKDCKWEWTQRCPSHRMGLIHYESDYCSYGIRKGADNDISKTDSRNIND